MEESLILVVCHQKKIILIQEMEIEMFDEKSDVQINLILSLSLFLSSSSKNWI